MERWACDSSVLHLALDSHSKKKKKIQFGKADAVQQIQGLQVWGRSGSAQRTPHSSDTLEQVGVIDLTEV